MHPVEPLKNVHPIGCRDARTVVLDGDGNPVGPRHGGHAHGQPLRGSILERVLQQIEKDLVQPVRVCFDGHACVDREIDARAFFSDRGFEPVNHLAETDKQRHQLDVKRGAAVFERRNREQILHQQIQAPTVFLHDR